MLESMGLGIFIAISICEIILTRISDHLGGIETALKKIAEELDKKED